MSALNEQTRAVIGVVLEAIDIPYAATTGGDETRARIMGDRVMQLKVSLRRLAEAADGGDRHMDETLVEGLAYLRKCLAGMPPTGYVTDRQARERCEAGATWTEAVRLDYAAPAREAG